MAVSREKSLGFFFESITSFDPSKLPSDYDVISLWANLYDKKRDRDWKMKLKNEVFNDVVTALKENWKDNAPSAVVLKTTNQTFLCKLKEWIPNLLYSVETQ